MNDYTLKLFKLTHLNINIDKSFETVTNEDETILDVYLNLSTSICHHCNSTHIKIVSSVTSKLNYSIFVDHKTILKLHRRKFQCKDCNKYFLEQNPFVSYNRNISFNTDLRILELLKDPTMTYSKAGKLTSTSPSYVQAVFDNRISFGLGKLSPVICIDEVYAKELVKNHYICVFINPFDKSAINVLSSRRKKDLFDFTAKYSISERLKVKYVSIDLWDTYRDVAKTAFPNCIICADSFHVIKNLMVCFNKIRISFLKKYEYLKKERSSLYWLLKKYNFVLYKDFLKLKDYYCINKVTGEVMSKYQIRSTILSIDPKFQLAYDLKEAYRSFNFSASILDAEDRLTDLIQDFLVSKIPEFIPFVHLLKKWKKEIVNSFSTYNGHRIHNGYIVRRNFVIKQLFANAYGFYNFPRTRNRILYVLNYDTIIRGSSDKISNALPGKPRGKYNKN